MSEESAQESSSDQVAVHPSFLGTLLLLVSLTMTWNMLDGKDIAYLVSTAAQGAGIGIGLSMVCDFQMGWRNMIRADLSALLALYFLTLFEFLLPQQEFIETVRSPYLVDSIGYIFLGIGSLAVGRHFTSVSQVVRSPLFTAEISSERMVQLFWGCFALGYFHMLLAVNFNVVEWYNAVLEPRFFQPWARGRFGDWKALLNEFAMLLYLLPPLMGVVVARLERYGFWSVVGMMMGTLVTFFYGFTSGTRNVFCTYLVTFVIGYLFAVKKEHEKRILIVAGVAMALLMVATNEMLHFREIGFGAYLRGEMDPIKNEQAVFVDMNLVTIMQIVGYFPKMHDYLGLEIPYLALVRPIPRALWPGKPQGMSVSMEQVVDADEAYTVAASFVGEAYMSGGAWGVIIGGLLIGALVGWWNRFGSQENSDWGILIYASGFFSAVITMRSLFVFTTAILPTMAALFIGYYLTEEIKRRRKEKENESWGSS